MAESVGSMSPSDQPRFSPSDTLSITSINESDRSPGSAAMAPEWTGQERQGIEPTVPIKTEDQGDASIDEVPEGQDGPHLVGLQTQEDRVFAHLQMAMDCLEVDALARHQSTGIRILEELTQILSSYTESADNSRISSVKALREKYNNPQTIIGVVGGTGHGKSSLINALLGEQKLVPTNCFRACTAVVTEISWNPSDDPDRRYIAEVEFISVEDWNRELGYLFGDLGSPSGDPSGEAQLAQSEAGIAWAKIKAVYPTLTKQTIAQTSAEVLVAEPAVASLLGTTRIVQAPTADELYKGIQLYVDSKKKRASKAVDRGKDITEPIMELWPLIKVVRIFTKSDVLSSGVVLVDLPGVKDSNAARAAVAGKYIEKCNNLWVVSMITRAVDDQTAQELLGESFKQQLKLDGNYLNITFVCSKTDDINVYEAADGLELDEDVEGLISAKRNLSVMQESTELEMLEKRHESISNYADEIERHSGRYEKLQQRQSRGQVVVPPKELPRTGGGDHRPTRANKRRKISSNGESQDSQWSYGKDFWAALEKDMPKYPAEHQLTQHDIQSMIEYLRGQKQAATDEKEVLRGKILRHENRIEELEEEVTELEEQLHVACISKRNDLSRQSIRDQFALGLKELDQLEAQSIDPEEFDPENDLRDYTEIGSSLPVFCISSQAYRSLVNKERVVGFSDISDTEIPQLRAHAKMLTESTRKVNAKSFLNDLAQILNSLYLWSSGTSSELYLTEEEKHTEMEYVKEQINELDKRLSMANRDLIRGLNDILEALFKYLEAAAIYAIDCAPDIARRWPSRERGDGGLCCRSYQAIIRRNGVFSGKAGPRDFNEDLAAPLLRKLGNDWEITFTRKIPEAIEQHAATCRVYQEFIHGLISSRLRGKVAFNGVSGMLKDQDKARTNGLTDKINSLTLDITASQREANRGFNDAIMKKLTPKYKECSEDKGPGVFSRIRLEIETEISRHRRAIFNASLKVPKATLSSMPRNIHNQLRAYVDIMRDSMISDYSNVILGAKSSREPKLVKERVFVLLNEADERFR